VLLQLCELILCFALEDEVRFEVLIAQILGYVPHSDNQVFHIAPNTQQLVVDPSILRINRSVLILLAPLGTTRLSVLLKRDDIFQ